MKKITGLLFITVLSITVNAQKVDQLKWLLGVWKINTGNGYVVEKWIQNNDSTLTGKSMFVKIPGDSAIQETIELSLRKGQWSYTPTVVNQNNGQPVTFHVFYLGRGEFICENPAHDFPQRIAYRRIKNSLHASIEGRRNGVYSKRNFDFTNEH
jgi:hypothetical protein